MKTMTIDSMNGVINTEFNWLENKTRKVLSKITDEYIKDCIDNDIETLSAEGAFYDMVFQCMTESRIYQSYEHRKNSK